YLGASQIGHACDRFLWYSIRPDIPSRPRSAYLIKCAESGHRGEALMAEWLRSVPGIELWTKDDSTGEQHGFSDFGGRFQGHIDGVILGLLQAPGTPHIWECKVTDKLEEFRKAKRTVGEKQALQAWNPVYYAQAVIYMDYFDLTR